MYHELITITSTSTPTRAALTYACHEVQILLSLSLGKTSHIFQLFAHVSAWLMILTVGIHYINIFAELFVEYLFL